MKKKIHVHAQPVAKPKPVAVKDPSPIPAGMIDDAVSDLIQKATGQRPCQGCGN